MEITYGKLGVAGGNGRDQVVQGRNDMNDEGKTRELEARHKRKEEKRIMTS